MTLSEVCVCGRDLQEELHKICTDWEGKGEREQNLRPKFREAEI